MVVHLPFSVRGILRRRSDIFEKQIVEVCLTTCGYHNEHLFASLKSNCMFQSDRFGHSNNSEFIRVCYMYDFVSLI